MLRIVLDEEAERDLVAIWKYIANDNPRAADRLLDLIEKRLESLAQFPRFGEARSDLAPDLRCYPVGSYVIFYRPTDREIQVARVLHGARDAAAIFRRH